ncbi:MAG: hypothetical protein R3C11_18730 [Planctomycetaceae bacterium]
MYRLPILKDEYLYALNLILAIEEGSGIYQGDWQMRLICCGIVICLLTASGCMHRGRDKIVYFRPEYNSLNRLSFNIDKFSHQPPRARNVDHYRWMYNKGPIDHTLLPELYTHEPITSQTLTPVVSEQVIKPETQAVEGQPWQWSSAPVEQQSPQPVKIAQPVNSDIQLLSGQMSGQTKVNQSRSNTVVSRNRPTYHSGNNAGWIFNPVTTR